MRFWHSSIWIFRWVSYRSFNLLPGFMKRNVLLILHFDDFLFDLPFRATSHICWMIAITIGTFCFVVTFMIVMSSLSTFCTFCFVLAESFVVAVFLTIKTTLWIWNVNFCVTNQETNFDLRGMFWLLMVNMFESEGTNCPSFRLFMRSTLVTACDCSSFFMSSSSIFLSSLHPITHLEELSALWGVTLTGTSINLSALRRLSL